MLPLVLGRAHVAQPEGPSRDLAQPGPAELSISGYVQFRYDSTRRSGESDLSGFTANETRLALAGDVRPGLSIELEGGFDAFDDDEGTFDLLDAVIGIELADRWRLDLGQFDHPFLREELISDPDLLATEQGLLEAVFSVDRGQGAMLVFEADRVRTSVMISDGADGENTVYSARANVDAALAARAAFRLGGASWGKLETLTGPPMLEPGALLGVAAFWQTGDEAARGDGADEPIAGEVLSLTADAQLEGDGQSAFFAAAWRRSDTGAGTFDDWGLSAEAGVYVLQQAEVFARYSVILPDGDRPGETDAFQQITGGLNYYFVPASQAARLTLEVIHYPDGPQGHALIDAEPDRGLAPSGASQTTLRAQLQVMF